MATYHAKNEDVWIFDGLCVSLMKVDKQLQCMHCKSYIDTSTRVYLQVDKVLNTEPKSYYQ